MVRTLFAVLTAAALAVALTSVSAVADDPRVDAAADALPNVVIILSDDQPLGTLDAMPTVTSELEAQGVFFSNGMVPTSLCCPSRSSLLTGNYAHHTGVWTNRDPVVGGWPAFHRNGDEASTLATHLHDVGYSTGLFGKYLNGYNLSAGGEIPPGWDQFVYLSSDKGGDGAYYNYELKGTIPTQHFGSEPEDYATDVTASLAAQFVANTSDPLFLYWSPFGPHAPMKPPPRYVDSWPLEPASAIPALGEKNVTDKPAWVQALPLANKWEMRKRLTKQHEALMAIDDGVAQILQALGPKRAANTLFVYLSDNGLMNGSHNITSKNVAYDVATRVPMIARWDGHLPAGAVWDSVTPQIDLTAAIAEAAGVSRWRMDGVDAFTQHRQGSVLEASEGTARPSYCGWRSQEYLFVQYGTGETELYDYATDPEELHNLAGRQAWQDVVTELRARARAACVPRPPGFHWHRP